MRKEAPLKRSDPARLSRAREEEGRGYKSERGAPKLG